MYKEFSKRSDDLEESVKGDEAQKSDAHIHAGIEGDGGEATHEGSELPGSQVCVREDFEGKHECHYQVSHQSTFEVDDEGGGAGNVDEHPQGQSVQRDAGEEDDGVDGWEHQLCYPCVPGARLRPIEALHHRGIHDFQCQLLQINKDRHTVTQSLS